MVYKQLKAYVPRIAQHASETSIQLRAHNSTETAVLKVISDILGAADQGYVALLSLLDMSAVFLRMC